MQKTKQSKSAGGLILPRVVSVMIEPIIQNDC